MGDSDNVSAAASHLAAERSSGVPLLEIRDLEVRRGKRPVLEGLSLAVRPGEVFGLLGPNGAGKTTLFGVLTGLLGTRGGSLLLEGRPLTASDSEFRSRTGVVFQQPALDPRLSARENLRLAARLYGVPRRTAIERAARLLDRAGLSERANEPVERLSGGMRRKVELARALIHEPSLLILDEPTTGLDEAAFRRFWSDLLEERRQRDLTLLLTTHRPEEAEYCERIGVLDGGRLIACDSPDRLREAVRGDLLILEADDPAQVARDLTERLGIDAEQFDGKLILRRNRAHELVPRIVEALPDGTLQSISMRRAGLGEAFLALTGHELDPGPNPWANGSEDAG